MKHHRYNEKFQFVVPPVEFNKYTRREVLQYCVGASMYMPGTKDISRKIIDRAMPGLTAMVMCFEDACPEDMVKQAEINVLSVLNALIEAIDNGEITYDDIPLIFCRVRSVEQFKHFASMLTSRQIGLLAGFNFPKFNKDNGEIYFKHLQELNDQFGEILYGLPILEDEEVAYKETRMEELFGIKKCLDKYKELVLQVRVGATDFSSYFGMRRGVDYSIYDIMPVREILCDILNVFSRQNDYIVSGPVWEYFRVSKEMMFEEIPDHDITDKILKRMAIFNDEVDGLLREIIMDKANGFVGRTVIHPTHVKYVNALQAVTVEEYEDACEILNQKDGVVKSKSQNKMNEIKPHTNWAKKVCIRAEVYGVIENEKSYFRLFAER